VKKVKYFFCEAFAMSSVKSSIKLSTTKEMNLVTAEICQVLIPPLALIVLAYATDYEHYVFYRDRCWNHGGGGIFSFAGRCFLQFMPPNTGLFHVEYNYDTHFEVSCDEAWNFLASGDSCVIQRRIEDIEAHEMRRFVPCDDLADCLRYAQEEFFPWLLDMQFPETKSQQIGKNHD
jgi:hypothetical protein